jgi:hypothetical protein
VEALRARGVPLDLGRAIVATDAPFAETCLGAIRETGVERTLVFNKSSLMLLPGGVTKATGLAAALTVLELSAHNVVAIGDAENDHAFLAVAECAVAVADAIPALRERADYVTRAGNGSGVCEFIEEQVLNDLVDLAPRLIRHRLPLGRTAEGEPVGVPAHGTGLLVVGPSASSKSTLTGLLVERLIEAGRSFCLLDPEGDYDALAELESVIALGGRAEQALPPRDELIQLLKTPPSRLVLNLSAMSMAEKAGYATTALSAVAAVRGLNGLPHWLIVDEAHHLFPAEGSAASELLKPGAPLCLITLSAEHLARNVLPLVNAVASTDLAAFRAAVAAAPALTIDGAPLDTGDTPLARGQAIMASIETGTRRTERFQVAPRKVQQRRHIRKYTEGELAPERSFFFRGPHAALNLRAANLTRFCELAEGVDAATWTHHLQRGDYSAWIAQMIKDPELAVAVRVIEREALPAAESRRRVGDAIRRRYAV